MGTVNVVVMIESVSTIVQKEGDELGKFHLPSVIAVAVALGTTSESRQNITLMYLNPLNSRQAPAVPIQLLHSKTFQSSASIVGGPPQ